MTSKTTTKAASSRTGRKKHSVKKPDRINRQRRLQKQLQILVFERHSRRCIICHHPEREAIEELRRCGRRARRMRNAPQS